MSKEKVRALRDCSYRLLATSLAIFFFAASPHVFAQELKSHFSATETTPPSQQGWQKYSLRKNPHSTPDELQGGRTSDGAEVYKKLEVCLPPEPNDVFGDVDKVGSGPGGSLKRINYDLDKDGHISEEERNAIRGHNTWMLWGEGNESFWNWLQQSGYGLHDFLVLLDSRKRKDRFSDYGLLNQPGFTSSSQKNALGLYLDRSVPNKAKLQIAPSSQSSALTVKLLRASNNPYHKHFNFEVDPELEKSNKATTPPKPSTKDPAYKTYCEISGNKAAFQALNDLPEDGVDSTVYGYPSGVIGLRLFPNPEFFGREGRKARQHWAEQVLDQPDQFYSNYSVTADPTLVRPFKPSMSCAFCHAAPHPLLPPDNPAEPKWENISSTIGNQYWRPERCFGNLTDPSNFLYHFLRSQQPGTIDTSLVSTDHINNANTINSVFEVPARLELAMKNPPEKQSRANLLLPGTEDKQLTTNPRHTPRVLLDGADSVGVFGALARVYLNIGTYWENWKQCHNPIIGFHAQRPFTISDCEANSVYWRSAQKFRTGCLASFFTLRSPADVQQSGEKSSALQTTFTIPPPVRNATTSPMKLGHAPGGLKELNQAGTPANAARGQMVFLKNCAICHSSKQPDSFTLDFSRGWRAADGNAASNAMHIVAPMDFSEWEHFKAGSSYKKYTDAILKLAQQNETEEKHFFDDNYLSTDIRIPVTLVGTNSGRAVATNAMSGQIWDNFSSEDYKHLPAVGAIHFYNPYRQAQPDAMGLNDFYYPPSGGPGYYRPASLVGLWATAPYLHNNTLGQFSNKPSVSDRVACYKDGITKLLWNDKRAQGSYRNYGDLRLSNPELTGRDPGFIYRTPVDSYIIIKGKFINALLTGVVGEHILDFAGYYFWICLTVIFGVLTCVGKHRHAALALTFTVAILFGATIFLQLGRVYWWSWLIILVLFIIATTFWCLKDERKARGFSRVILLGHCVLSLLIPAAFSSFRSGNAGDLSFGPIPKGTPVNLLMNINGDAPIGDLLNAGSAMLRATLILKNGHSDEFDALKAAADKAFMGVGSTAELKDAIAAIVRKNFSIKNHRFNEIDALNKFESEAAPPLMKVSKCPDFVLDKGHWFGESLTDAEKKDLIVFLLTL